MRCSKKCTGLAAMLALVCAMGLANAQGRPGGGMGGGMGGQMPGGPAGKAAPRNDNAPPDLESLIPPDPWHLWRLRLIDSRAALALTDAQQPAFEAFMRALDDVQKMNERRVVRAITQAPPVTSARTDIDRDIQAEASDAADWAGALTDLSLAWRTLRDSMSPEQQALLEADYRQRLAGGPAKRLR